MFTLGVQRRFKARHFLIGGNWGAENNPHEHNYRLELRLEGERLDRHGFLADIETIEKQLDRLLGDFEGKTLNELPDFESLNPSVERFARILCASMARRIRAENLQAMTLKLWEHENAWASYRLEF